MQWNSNLHWKLYKSPHPLFFSYIILADIYRPYVFVFDENCYIYIEWVTFLFVSEKGFVNLLHSYRARNVFHWIWKYFCGEENFHTNPKMHFWILKSAFVNYETDLTPLSFKPKSKFLFLSDEAQISLISS